MFAIIETLGSFIMIISVFAIIAAVITSFLNYRLKKRILDAGPVDENTLKLIPAYSRMNTEMLKWGVILLFAGLGLIVLEYIPYDVEKSTLPYGIETVFIAIGFLVYFYIVKNKQHQD
ncbi:hypothetical protein [Chitinophaga sp. CF418]|uniref:hypothetical protein n=1 Tax=Chitinophaga sp. CF418 TaxID=1855287 RepID=UPI00091C0A47|nr:hypothetical protein [Chitinophaga sp. CF418]SHN43835.1 hypothetical protein SAMN05216311_11684 [Chitinophaga sp. CF418]